MPPIDTKGFAKSTSHLKPMEQLIEVALDKAIIDRVVKVEMTLPKERQVQLINFLWENTEVFT